MRILIIGGNRFFGKKLAATLVDYHDLSLLNRGNLDDSLGMRIERIKCDRTDNLALEEVFQRYPQWDVIFDHCCYNAQDARSICRYLKGKTRKYVFISSQSVYDLGENISEESFDPFVYSFIKDADKDKDYAEAKRQAESVFFQEASFPVIAVRFPIVMGEDDYTQRLLFHIEKVRTQNPIFFPNIKAQLSSIHSDDASKALSHLIELDFKGPLNIAAPRPLSLEHLMNLIELEQNKAAIYASKESENTFSPFGIENDWFMNTGRLNALGINVREISDWLPQLIHNLST